LVPGRCPAQRDLEAAGIPYKYASGLVFDFHALRCEMATLADAAGVSPRVVQRLMRHSSLELTGRDTRPRTVDVEAAASMLPSLKPAGDRPEGLALTGTDGGFAPRHPSDPTGPDGRDPENHGESGPTHRESLAPSLRHFGDAFGRAETLPGGMAHSEARAPGNEKPLFPRGSMLRDGLRRFLARLTGLGLEPRTNGLKVRCSTD
jgi:hypothetical protein